jgi:hypothetical protein
VAALYASASCVLGRCRVAQCDDGWADCDGDGHSCEANLHAREHCGACDVACSGSCREGTCGAIDCADQPGRADCDHDGTTCESNLVNDVAHCGNCSTTCHFGVESPHAKLRCAASQCRPACDFGYADCDGDYLNGCEKALSHVESCGACNVSCQAEHAVPSCISDDGTLKCGLDSCAADWFDCDHDSANGCERGLAARPADATGACLPDNDCTRATLQGHDYYLCATARNWNDALTTCRSQLRGNLAQLSSAEVATFISKRLRERSWVGHNDLAHQDLWVWANSGAPFWAGGGSGQPVHGAYARWVTGQPDSSGRCGSLATSGLMDGLDCAQALPFVCEISPDLCPEDPVKYNPGQCGCGALETDSDANGYADCAAKG